MVIILFSLLIVIVLMKYMTSSPPTPTLPKRTITDYDHKKMEFFQAELDHFQKSNEYITNQKIRDINLKYSKLFTRMTQINSDNQDVPKFIKNYKEGFTNWKRNELY
ncbi:hypothetical protein [Candidatus Enterococcus murrayae]|uniref:Uncharacterized protein n=1 Tax=Candidatus Enterococcus murrayae TaxID=2815321 RepID=A0ABS3HGP3_9ENTE|nr:hypothetical protein [Enterococcus sp. MJM16]MBO0452602.1 hypothetical protein [Enterococcus sp. MJM16]